MTKIDDKTIRENKKINRRLFGFYIAISSDLIFYYTISYLFLVNVKGLTTAQILFADSFYPIFKLLFQIPSTILIEKIGKKNSLIVANVCLSLYLLFVIGLVNTTTLIIANIFCAIGFVIKGIAESNLLYDSLEDTKNKQNNFAKYQGNSLAAYYFIEAITAILSGFLFTVNPYIPMIASFIVSIIAIFINLALREIPLPNEIENENEKNSIIKQMSKYLIDIKDGFKAILKSKRLKSLIIFNALFASILNITVTMRRSVLTDVNVSSEYFGIIFAVLGMISCYSSTQTYKIHTTLKNRSLTAISLLYTFSMIIAGLVVLLSMPQYFMYALIIIAFAIQYFLKGPFYTLIKQYLNSFANSNIRLKIYSANAVVECIINAILSFWLSYLTGIYTNSVAMLIFGIVCFTIFSILLAYMKKHVGLKPEQYPKEDILE